MQEDWVWGFAGGLLIGLGAAIYLLGNGRIMGASGIVGGLVDGSGGNSTLERSVFIAAVIITPLLLSLFGKVHASTHLSGSWLQIATAGVLVGLGTRIANGCTSGHGVCGISRLAPRGIVATLTYIASGAVTVFLVQQLMDFT